MGHVLCGGKDRLYLARCSLVGSTWESSAGSGIDLPCARGTVPVCGTGMATMGYKLKFSSTKRATCPSDIAAAVVGSQVRSLVLCHLLQPIVTGGFLLKAIVRSLKRTKARSPIDVYAFSDVQFHQPHPEGGIITD